MEKKLKSIDWLENELKKQGFLYDLDLEVANDLHKKEIIKAYNDGFLNYQICNSEQYYKENYGSI
jgi:hypothetical protein